MRRFQRQQPAPRGCAAQRTERLIERVARCSSGGTAPETATSITPTFSPPRRSHRVRPSSAAAAERDEHELAGRRRRRRGARRGACLEAAEGAMCPRRARPRRRGCGLGGESESDERKTDEEKTAAGPACDPGTLVGRACDRSWAEPPTDLWSSCRPVVGRATDRLVVELPTGRRSSHRPNGGRASDRPVIHRSEPPTENARSGRASETDKSFMGRDNDREAVERPVIHGSRHRPLTTRASRLHGQSWRLRRAATDL